ncbi:MAG TPA: hypothetical protein VHE14_07955 [Solirubrobacteraceae bacterium]|nr:hypothetical protein [Solirubrobacteraceae bacterium]
MAWEETFSLSFRARHETADADDAARVLEALEQLREHLATLFDRTPGDITVVLHPSELSLALAHPYLPVARRLTAPAARRYMAGWFGGQQIHLLAPQLLERRASGVRGSLELLRLTPQGLYARLTVGLNNPGLPPPFKPRSFVRALRWAWLAEGAGVFFSGQTAHARPAIARRLHEEDEPTFPPALRDSTLLGGTVFDLLAREEGIAAAVRLACRLHAGGAQAALHAAFPGRSLAHTEAAWRSHLKRLSERDGPADDVGSQPKDERHESDPGEQEAEQPQR